MQSEESDDPGLAVEPVGQSPNSNSQVCEFYAQDFFINYFTKGAF